MGKLKDTLREQWRKRHTPSSIESNQSEASQWSPEGSPRPFSFPDGVEVLHECPDATVDICFVHGLTGNRDSTWTAYGQSTPWPKTLLPPEFGRARILTYGYDAYIVRKSVAGSNRLIDHAANFLNDLTTDRARHNASSRALIFVAHGLGGLVCKKAILLSRNNPEAHLQGIFNCTKGIVFMGTPHKGSWMADWAKIPADAFGLVKSANKSLLKILETDYQLLEAIQVDFWSMVRELRENGRRIGVTCFFEELPLPVAGKIVSKESATLEGYSSFSIHANHSDMVKFGSAKETGFKRLLGELERWEADVSTPYVLDNRDRQCLKDLWATDLEDEKVRIQQTKGGLLEDVYSWILENPDYRQWRDDQQRRLLWIRGDPGKGKTMLLCGIVDELKKSNVKSQSLSFFFCQATDSRINNATAVLRGLIRQLVNQQPSLISRIHKKYVDRGKELFEDINSWVAVSQILTDILEDCNLRNIILVIDGLDECLVNLRGLLDMIMQKWSSYSHVKWIVSSRNWPRIHERLDAAGQLSLELNAKSISTAVGLYIQHKVRQLVKLKKYDHGTRDAVQQYLIQNADGTFLWAALVCQYLEKMPRDPLTKLQKFPPGLNPLYERMMKEILESEILELEDIDFCKQILGFMTAAYRPTTLKELASFIETSEAASDNLDSLKTDIGLCGSFLTVKDNTVYFVHQSAKDFLVEKASSEIFPSGMEEVHYTIFSRSLQTMRQTLRRDIYSLHAPGFPVDQVKQPERDPLASVRYSCIHWVNHLQDCHSRQTAKRHEDLQDGGMVDKFLREKYLHWLEALALLGGIPEGIIAISRLEGLAQQLAEDSRLLTLIWDARRFILYFKVAIEIAPLQVYHSALVFSPTCSLIRGLFEKEKPQWIRNNAAIEGSWSACLQTLEGHSNSISSVTFSHDSNLLASASWDKTVKVWNVSNGQCLQTLEGHSGAVSAAIFSHDSKLLASASGDETVKVWASNGQCLQTLKGHSGGVSSVTFSHDSKLLASASDDETVRVWDAGNWQCLQTLEGHSGAVTSVTFTHDSKLLASGSEDCTVRVWDASDGQCLQTLKGHRYSVRSVTFSHNTKLLASGSWDKSVRVWDASNGQCLQTIEGHSGAVTSVTFSHNSKLLASTSADCTIKIWDASDGQCLQTLKGHRYSVRSVTFSHDSKLLISASDDATVRVWDASNGQCLQNLKGHSDTVNSVTFSHDSKLLTSGSWDGAVKIWDASNGQCLQTLGIEHTVSIKSFDSANSCLSTDKGPIHLSPVSNQRPREADLELPQLQGYSVSPDNTWITWKSETLLWLPPDYRPCVFAVAQSIVCIGCPSGRVLIFNFDSDIVR